MSTYNISKSSLLSLKAEINRKQEELNKAKLQNEIKKAQLKKPLEIKNKDVEQRRIQDGNDEDVDLLEKSRTALESKAKLYEKLSKRSNFTEDEIEQNRRYLVRFDAKSNNLPPEDSDEADIDKYRSDDEEQHFSDEYEPAKNPEEEWVEYTDCLGRTRKCMRKDLEFLKSKDADLRATLDKTGEKDKLDKTENVANNLENREEEEAQKEFDEKSELLSSDMRRELLRQQWEKEEEKLKQKSDIHYQDILFNEARMHGVGYYAFSKDEEERARQQEALKNLREETELKQKRAEELRSLREKQLAARAKAARNRKRARMGLPPEEDEPEAVQQPQSEEEGKDKEKESLKAMEEKKEREKEAARKKHVRPWDIGKEGVREHYEYSQEEWNEKKRKERPTEFAPPSSYYGSSRNETKEEDDSETDKTLYFSSKKPKRKYGSDIKNKKDDETFFVDTSKPPPTIRKHHINPYKTKETFCCEQKSTITSEPTPIINECEDFDEEQDRLFNDYKSLNNKQSHNKTVDSSESDSDSDSNRGKGVEIAPPPTFDYYGPSGAKKSKPANKSKGNLEDSIAAGLKFLRNQAEKKSTSSKHPSEMFLL